jgi:hypothetical protein
MVGMARQDGLEGLLRLGQAVQRQQRCTTAQKGILEAGVPGDRRLEGLERLLGPCQSQ